MTARPKARQMTALTGGLAVSLLLLSGCAKQHLPQDTFNPAGPVASKEAGLYWFVFWIAVAVFVLVEGLHRLEACRQLGEETIFGYLVQARRH